MVCSLRSANKWGIRAALFLLTAVAMLFFYWIMAVVCTLVLWLTIPTGLVLSVVLVGTIVLFYMLLLIARRKCWDHLVAASLGGLCLPALVVALVLCAWLLPHSVPFREANRRQPLLSPSGRYTLTIPIERTGQRRGLLRFRLPYWHVTILRPDGKVLYRDPENSFPGWFSVYWIWDQNDRAWLYDSEGHGTYLYEQVDGLWTKRRWKEDERQTTGDVEPPLSLYPRYMTGGPVPNRVMPWGVSGFGRDLDPSGGIKVWFQHIYSAEGMLLRVGETKNGLTLVEADEKGKRAVVEFKGKRYTLLPTFGMVQAER